MPARIFSIAVLVRSNRMGCNSWGSDKMSDWMVRNPALDSETGTNRQCRHHHVRLVGHIACACATAPNHTHTLVDSALAL